MKIFLLIFLLTTLSLSAQDIRSIGGRAVDLTAVQVWFNTHQGERPMKHWKQIYVNELKAQIATWDNCVVSLDDGTSREILLAHCDAVVRVPLAALTAADAKIIELEAEIASANGQSTQLSQRNAIAVQRVRASQARDAEAVRRQLENLKYNRDKVLLGQAQDAQRRGLLAMFTGQKYAGLEVWDCGARR